MLKIFQKLSQKRQRFTSFHSLLKGSDALRAQGYQDLFALVSNNFKRDGFFVEFGATNGKDLSNTWILEKDFNWNGILAEPGRVWHEELFSNRRCKISTDCVWSVTGQTLDFLETNEPTLSTIQSYANSDGRNRNEISGHSKYQVATISLTDLLKSFDAPKRIDFMSVDTEGSEFEILENLAWDIYSFNAICIEHNYTPARKNIYDLLITNGYRRVYEGISGSDDWYQQAN